CCPPAPPPTDYSPLSLHDALPIFLVAPPDGHEAVKARRSRDRLDGVGDDLARHQRIAHARSAHRDAVRHRDGVEQHALATAAVRSEEHTSELQSLAYLVCRLLLEK